MGLALSDRESGGDVAYAGDALFVLEPELAMEANIVSFMRVQLSLTYRQAWDVEIVGLDNQDLSGVAGGLAFLFGTF